MVYVDSFDSFTDKAKVIYKEAPEKTRFSTKYRHCDGAAILMVTDDRTCVQFRVTKAEELRYLEEFNRLMVRMMSRGPDAEEPTEEERRAYEKQEATVQETQTTGRRSKKRR